MAVRPYLSALALTVVFSSPALADADNYNPTAAGNASGTGIANANCNSALILSCDPASAGPAPMLGGGITLLTAALTGLFLKRRRNRK